MTLAVLGHDLRVYSEGRFVLGLGSQVRAHITRRFAMPWSRPAARMREFVEALRAIWACWNEARPLDFPGRVLPAHPDDPMFDPGPSPYGPPPVFLAGVGPRMTEVADGLFVHSFTTEAYLRSHTLPALDRGLSTSGRSRAGVVVSVPVFVVTGRDGAERDEAARVVRKRLAFYGSTPAYEPVLAEYGWGEAHTELHRLSQQGQWTRMADVFDDTMLRTFAVVAEPGAVGATIVERYGDVADRVSCSMPYDADRSLLRLVAAGFPDRAVAVGS